MAVGWAPKRLKADPNASGVNRLDTDDILAPHSVDFQERTSAVGRLIRRLRER
jgi:hypothetical protein